MRKDFKYFSNMGFKTNLLISYIILITIPVIIIGFRYYTNSKKVLSDIAAKNAYEIVRKNNVLLDTQLTQVRDAIYSFITDKDLYNSFSRINPSDDYSIRVIDNTVSNIMSKYFSNSENIYSAQLATSYYTFGPRQTSNATTGKNFIPEGGFTNSVIYKIAKNDTPGVKWIPTYDFTEMFNLPYMKNANIDYRYLFSAVEMVQASYFNGRDYLTLAPSIEKPVLIVNIKEDFFRNIFSDSIPIDGSTYYIVTPSGHIVSSEDQSKIAKSLNVPWLKKISQKGSGIDTVTINNKKMLICYDTSKLTGWISIVCIPPDRLVSQIMPSLKSYILYAAVILILLSILISYFISIKISSPIRKLTKAASKIGEGDFNIKIEEEGSYEFRRLIRKFNNMNEKIQKLINENYEIKIKESQAEINALNLQLDPHFMYNTLNLISLISLEKGDEEISDLIINLSNMLKYTVKIKGNIVPFKEDIKYLKGYITIMSKRFEGKFSVLYEIDEELYNYDVPKFFMQPFVENSLIHGFSNIKSGGLLKISCWIKNDLRYFSISDNGKGIDSDTLTNILSEHSNNIGIKNVNERIKIIYGEEYGVHIESEINKGTNILITLPINPIKLGS